MYQKLLNIAYKMGIFHSTLKNDWRHSNVLTLLLYIICSFEDDSVWQRFPLVVCLYQEKKWGTVSYEMFFNVRYQENCYFNGNILQYLKSVMFKFSFLFPWFNQTFDFLISFHSVLRFCILLTSTIGFFQDILGRNEYPFIWFESSCLPSLETSTCQ